MSLSSRHPEYRHYLEDWTTMRDTYKGQRAIKQQGQRYLPATSGMVYDGMRTPNDPGYRAYTAYLKRAVFPDIVEEAVLGMLGVMHHKPPVIELPAAMEPLREKATLSGESLEMLLRRINEHQLVYGRCGLLLDFPANMSNAQLPYIALYSATDIINWDAGTRKEPGIQSLNLVVLDETEPRRTTDFEWEDKESYRVLVLGDVRDNEASGPYSVATFEEVDASFNAADLVVPSIRGNQLDEIPFVFVNTTDIVPEVANPPLLGLAELCLAIYRAEADYRQSLFLQGQDTLVTIGAGSSDDDLRIGSGGHINIPQGGDAKFIGVSSTGLSEQRAALQNDYTRAASKGGSILNNDSGQKESGDALKIRVAARTANLNQVALTGAYGLQELLRVAARWIGANPEEVVVTPNLDFSDSEFQPDDLVKLITAKNLGAPVSSQTIHNWLQRKDFTDLDFETESDNLEAETPPASSLDGVIDDDGE